MRDDRVVPRNPLANPTEGDYGGNEGDVTEEDYEEVEDIDVEEMSDTLATNEENE